MIVPGVSSFQRVVRFRQMARRLGFVELVDFGGQDEITLRQTVNFVRPGCDLDFSPGEEDVWVVPLFLRSSPTRFTNLRASRKSGNLKAFVRWCSSITFHPPTCFCREASSSPLSGGTPPRQGTQALVARSGI